MVNCRKIDNEKNIFDGVLENPYFVVIWFIIGGGQAIIIEFSGPAFKVATGGLHYSHWIIAIGLGFSTWIVRFFLTFVPDKWCPEFGKKQKNPLEDEDKNVLSYRRKRTQSFSLR
jgi:hypothetical protein